MGVALEWLWGGYWLPTACLPNGFVVALRWLYTPEYMPSICLLYGFVVALGGFDGYDAAAPCRGQRATVSTTPAPQTTSLIRIPRPHNWLK